MRKPRNLSPEERDLWQRIADETERLAPVRRVGNSIPSLPKKNVSNKPEPVSIPTFHIGSKPTLTTAGPPARPAHIAMDHKAYRKMKSGKLRPEARLDLHGMTLEQAHPRLIRFIEASSGSGRRLVLVITGKGRPRRDDSPIPTRPGVLRRQVPHWLGSMPMVLQISEAGRKHGGAGALYVYLRKRRS